MKISLNTLKYYVDINVPVEELCDKMVMAGFEVENIEKEGENLQNVVVARIEKVTPHENSDHLQICQMNIGKEELVQIVTGAQNIKEGDLVDVYGTLTTAKVPKKRICPVCGTENVSVGDVTYISPLYVGLSIAL